MIFQILGTVTTPPGSMYYHLALLFALQVLFALAWGERNRPGMSRLVWAAAGLLLTRLLLALAGAIVSTGLASAPALLPPLERFLDLCLILLTGWALLPLFRHHPRLGSGLTGAGILMAAAAYTLSAAQWFQTVGLGLAYNNSLQALIWEAASAALAGLALLLLIVWPRPGAGLLAAVFVAWTAGHLAQIGLQLLTPPDAIPHLAGAVRLANLIAVPLAAAVALQEAAAPSRPLPTISPRLLDIVRHALHADDSLAALAAALPDLVEGLGGSSGMLALAKNSYLQVVAIHPSGSPPSLTISLDDEPALADAVASRRFRQATAQESSPLCRRIGFPRPTPPHILPQPDQGALQALLVIATPEGFTAEQARIVEGLLSLPLLQPRRESQVAPPSQEELERVRAEAREFARRAAEAEKEAARQQKRVEELAEMVRIQEQRTAEPEQWQKQVEVLERERNRLLRELAIARIRRVPRQALALAGELEEPTAGLMSQLDRLLAGAGREQRKSLLRIRAEAERLRETARDLYETLKAGVSESDLEKEPFDPAEVIKEVVASLASEFEKQGLVVELDLTPDLPSIQADRGGFYRTIYYLLSNASSCSRPGQITVRGRGEPAGEPGSPSNILISISDNGEGIPQEDLGRIFEEDGPPVRGLGHDRAGLLFARALIEAHGGRLWAESKEGEGTTFHFIIPAAASTGGKGH